MGPLRLFEAFVGEAADDQSWLQRLVKLTSSDETYTQQLKRDGIDPQTNGSPLKALPPLAQAIGWLILTHPRMPMYPWGKDKGQPSTAEIDHVLTVMLSSLWNSPQCVSDQ